MGSRKWRKYDEQEAARYLSGGVGKVTASSLKSISVSSLARELGVDWRVVERVRSELKIGNTGWGEIDEPSADRIRHSLSSGI